MVWGPKYENPITGKEFYLTLEERQMVAEIDRRLGEDLEDNRYYAWIRDPSRLD